MLGIMHVHETVRDLNPLAVLRDLELLTILYSTSIPYYTVI